MPVEQTITRARAGSRTPAGLLGDLLVHFSLWIGATIMVLPFLWMVSTSLKPLGEVSIFPPEWIPHTILWKNYLDIFQIYPFARFGLNSIQIAVLATTGELVTCTLSAYAFARMRFPGRNLIFVLLLATLMVPGQVTMIPTFIMFSKIGWVNTYLPLIVPAWLGPAFGTFLMRQFFLTLPRDYNDAASIDGAGQFRIMAMIYVPLAKPAIATLALFAFLRYWNEFLLPVIYLNDENLMTLPVGLSFFTQQYNTLYQYLMAGSVVSIIPILLLFVFLQKYFVRGFVMSGLKG